MPTVSGTVVPAVTARVLLALTSCGGPDVAEAPALSEIDDLMWDTMEEQDFVTITMGPETPKTLKMKPSTCTAPWPVKRSRWTSQTGT